MQSLDQKPGGGSLVQRSPAAVDLGPGKRTLSEQLGPGTVPAHAAHAQAHQGAERNGLNAVITVVARNSAGKVVARWRARGHWDGQLPARHHGSRAPAGWTWSDPAARDTLVDIRADGSRAETVEHWGAAHGAATVDIVAHSIDDATSDDAADPTAKVDEDRPAAHGREQVAGAAAIGTDIDQLIERALGADRLTPELDLDDAGGDGAGALGGDAHGRTGSDTTIGGTGPGGPRAKADGDAEGSETEGEVHGTKHGSALGVDGGSEGGRFGGEGKSGDNGVRNSGAILGGVIAVPLALKSVVEVILLADAGDVTGEGAQLFVRLGKRTAGMTAAAVRELVAREARVACERELRQAIQKMVRSPKWLALSAEEQERAIRMVDYELQRRFFRGFGGAAKRSQRAAERALSGAAGAQKAIAQESLDAAKVGAEAAEVEPVAGRLPRNHQYAGKEFPRSELPPKYREKGLKFKSTGYPDFEPYALELPNGRKTVQIELTGSMRKDIAAAKQAAGIKKSPKGYVWHHVEDGGTMMLVPEDLHEIAHTGGRATYKDQTGVEYVP